MCLWQDRQSWQTVQIMMRIRTRADSVLVVFHKLWDFSMAIHRTCSLYIRFRLMCIDRQCIFCKSNSIWHQHRASFAAKNKKLKTRQLNFSVITVDLQRGINLTSSEVLRYLFLLCYWANSCVQMVITITKHKRPYTTWESGIIIYNFWLVP